MDNLSTDPVISMADPAMNIDMEKIKTRVNKLLDQRSRVATQAKRNRQRRKLEFNVDRAKPNQRSQDDGAEEYASTNPLSRIIPHRLINSFIAREKPIYQQYLATPIRVAVFSDVLSPTANCSPIEDFYTQMFRYNGAVNEFLRLIDVSQLHGYSILEVRFDASMPGLFRFIAHHYEDVSFPEVDSLDKAYVITICERCSRVEIEQMNISADHKKRLMDFLENEDKDTNIHRVLLNTPNGYLQANYSEHLKDFIVPFAPFSNGFPGSDKELNLFPLVYDQNDELKLIEKKGRAFYDNDAQRACTVLMSSVVEKHYKASNVYASLDNGGKSLSGDAAALKTQLLPDTIYDKQINFFSPPEPTMAAMQTINTIETVQASSIGQINFAANNRQDSRKTATELNSANQMAGMLSAITIANFSSFLSAVMPYTWKIVMEGIAVGLIQLPDTLPLETVTRKYIIKPAGDTDYVKRQEKLQQMLQMLPIVGGSQIGEHFIRRVIEFAFPDEKFVKEWAVEDHKKELLNSLVQICNAFMQSPQATANVPPEQLTAAQQLVAAAQQELSGGVGAPGMGQQPQQPSLPANAAGPSGPVA